MCIIWGCMCYSTKFISSLNHILYQSKLGAKKRKEKNPPKTRQLSTNKEDFGGYIKFQLKKKKSILGQSSSFTQVSSLSRSIHLFDNKGYQYFFCVPICLSASCQSTYPQLLSSWVKFKFKSQNALPKVQ